MVVVGQQIVGPPIEPAGVIELQHQLIAVFHRGIHTERLVDVAGVVSGRGIPPVRAAPRTHAEDRRRGQHGPTRGADARAVRLRRRAPVAPRVRRRPRPRPGRTPAAGRAGSGSRPPPSASPAHAWRARGPAPRASLCRARRPRPRALSRNRWTSARGFRCRTADLLWRRGPGRARAQIAAAAIRRKGTMWICVTSAARLRISISAMPGTTCGGRMVTSNWYGPAWPSKNTSGLPTCAASGAAAARRSTGRIFMWIAGCAASSSYLWMRRIQLPAASPSRVVRIALASASPHSRQNWSALLGGEETIVHVHRVRRCEVFEVLRAEEPVARRRRHQEIGKGPLHRREDGQENRAGNQRQPPSAPTSACAATTDPEPAPARSAAGEIRAE